MYYSYLIMPQYSHFQEHEEKPYWQIVIEYQPDEPEYYKFPNGINRLNGVGLSFLSKEQARKNAQNLENNIDSSASI